MAASRRLSAKSSSFQNLGVPPNPEDVGTYEGYRLNKNQDEVNYNNLPFVPGYENGGNMSDNTIDNNIVH